MISRKINAAEQFFNANNLGVWIGYPETEWEEWSEGLGNLLNMKYDSSLRLTGIFPDLKQHIDHAVEYGDASAHFELVHPVSLQRFSFELDIQYKDLTRDPVQITAYIQKMRTTTLTPHEEVMTILRSLAKIPGAVVFMTDSRARYTFLDGSGLESLGIESHKWIGKSIFDFLASRKEYAACVRKVLQGEGLFTSSNFNGHHFLDHLFPVYGHGKNEVLGIVGIQINVTENVVAQTELKEKNEILYGMFNGIPYNAYIFDLNYHLLEINDAACRSTSEQFDTDKTCFAAMYGRQVPCEQCPVSETYLTLQTARKEIFDDEHEKHFELTSFPIVERSSGRMLGVTEFVRDITQQKQTETSLQRNESFLVDLMEAMTDIVYQIDSAYTITRVNRAMNDTYPHLTPLVGRKCYETRGFGGICPGCVAERMFRERKAATCRFFESGNGDNNGKWLELTAFPQYKKDSNTIDEAICIVRNVTSQVELEAQVEEYRRQVRNVTEQKMEKLRLGEAKLTTILETSNAAICFLDREGRFIYFNKKFMQVSGYAEEDLLGLPYVTVIVNNENQPFTESFNSIVNGEIDHYRAERRVRTKDGRILCMDANVSVVRGSNVEDTQLIAVLVDITDRQHDMEMNRSERIRAENANLSKTLFFETANREIRTALGGIIGIADLLEQTSLTPHQQEYTRLIGATGESLFHTLNNIFDLSRIEEKMLKLEKSTFDLSDIVESTLHDLRSYADMRHTEVVVTYEKDVPFLYVGDGEKLGRILYNLAKNRLNASKKNGIRLHISRDKKQESLPKNARQGSRVDLVFLVVDLNENLSSEDILSHDNMFFEEITESLTENAQTIDWTVTKKLGEMMRGTVETLTTPEKNIFYRFAVSFECDPYVIQCVCESVPFCVKDTIPFCPGNHSLACPRSGRPIAYDRICFEREGMKIRIVGFDAPLRSALLEQLKIWSYHPESVSTFEELLGVLQNSNAETTVDAILIDGDLEDFNGEESIGRLREDVRFAKTPVIVLMRSLNGTKFPSLTKVRWCEKPVSGFRLREAIAQIFFADEDFGDTFTWSSDALREEKEIPLRILVAEDNRVNQVVIGDMLTNIGVVVEIVENGQEAVQAVSREQYDLVLMDCLMPVMDGYVATRHIRQWELETGASRMPIVALTANVSSQDEQYCLEMGMDDYLHKPVDKRRLADLLAKIRERKNSEISISMSMPTPVSFG